MLDYFILRAKNNYIKKPLIVYLHGYGENFISQRYKTQQEDSLPGMREKYPILQNATIVTPFTPNGIWWNCKQLMDFINIIIKQENIDVTRIYLCGVSMGAYAAWALMSKYPNKFAAVVPICGGTNPFLNRYYTLPFRWSEFDRVGFTKNTETAVWAFHGMLDIVVPYYESITNIKTLEQIGNSKCKLTIYKWKGHRIFHKTFNNPKLYEWLFKQKNY